jgi:DNA-binding SARP family transcriptional activator
MVEVRSGGGVEFSILGQLTVSIDGHQLNIGGARQRVVLAGLLLNAGRTVSVAELTELVWGHAPPSSARGQLHMAVHQLRRVLSRSEHETLLRTDPAGYRLLANPAQVDLTRFETSIARARTSAAGGERAAAVSAYRAALALWHDRPLRELANDALTRRTEWLCELRLAAAEECLELELASGRDRELIPELVGYVGEYPLRERLVAALMEALGRNGRLAEALEVYQRTVATLREDLGVDPGPELRRRHLELLRGDSPVPAPMPPVVEGLRPLVAEQPLVRPLAAQLMRAPHANGRDAEALDPHPSRPALAAPAQLPPDVFGFVGRHAAIARLDAIYAAAQPTTVIIALTGTAGVGKTALAVHWAHRVRDRFPDGQLYVNLRGFDPAGSAMSPADAVLGLIEAVNLSTEGIPASFDAQVGLLRSLLADKRMLIVLDNARDAEQVRPMLPGAPGCLIVVTSRNQLTSLLAADGAHLVALDLLTTVEARNLLAHRLGEQRVAAEPHTVDELIACSARLPLALVIMAARAATRPGFPLSLLAEELSDADRRLDTFTGGDTATDARAVFSWSYHALSDAAARLFRLLGLHPGPDIAMSAAASLVGFTTRRVRTLLAELVDAHLITEHTPRRYVLHDLLRAYATEQAHANDSDAERRAALHRILDHYLHTARTAALLLHPYRAPINVAPADPEVTTEVLTDHFQAAAWFNRELAVLLAAIKEAANAEFDTHTWQIAWAVREFLYRRGHWQDLVATQEAALRAARRLADPIGQAHAQRGLGAAHIQSGRYDDAHSHLQRALDLFGTLADHTETVDALIDRGFVFEGQRHYTEAVDNAQLALTLIAAVEPQAGRARALNNVGWLHTLLGRHQEAITYCQQALGLYQEIGDRSGQAATWDSLGHAHHHLGHHRQAIACHQQALDLCGDLPANDLKAVILTNLGDAHHSDANPDAALVAWKQALDMLDEIDHPDADQVRAKLHHMARPPGPRR